MPRPPGGFRSASVAPMDNGRPDPIEQDLDRVDAALSALDAGDLDEAEALAAELADSRAETGDLPQRAGTGDSAHPA